MTKKTVLVVDDSASLRHVLRDLLVRGDYNVIEGENGQDALAKSKGKPFT
jgi:two-component system chemotaxis response regulator CheY